MLELCGKSMSVDVRYCMDEAVVIVGGRRAGGIWVSHEGQSCRGVNPAFIRQLDGRCGRFLKSEHIIY